MNALQPGIESVAVVGGTLRNRSVQQVQLVPCVDVLSPFISAVNKIDEFRVGLKEQAGARVACGRVGCECAQRCVK